MENSQIHNFQEYLVKKQYSDRTICLYCTALTLLPDGIQDLEYDILYEHINVELISHAKELSTALFNNLRAAVNLYFLMLSGKTVKEHAHLLKEQKADKCDLLLKEFFHYSVKTKKISETTAKAECQHIRGFLENLSDYTYESLEAITALDIRNYVCDRLTELTASSKGRYVTSLRNFFSFLKYKEIRVSSSILKLPLSPADWNNGKVPVTLTKKEEEKLRLHYNNDNERDKRNHAITLILLDLGLRCAEVPKLKISDIQWYRSSIKIRMTKTKRDRELPIPKELGDALENYILNYRPPVDNQYLFLCIGKRNKGKSMDCEGVRRVIRHAFKKEGIEGWWKGTHALRRTVASRIYNSGAGLKLTADMLGHESLNSTTMYVKVDLESMKSITSCWPGGDDNDQH